jgi:hypothetical protein
MAIPVAALVPVSLYAAILGGADNNFDFTVSNPPVYVDPIGMLGSISILNLGPATAFAQINATVAPVAAHGNGIIPLTPNVPYNVDPTNVNNVWVSVAAGPAAAVYVTGLPQAGGDSGGISG